MRGGRRVVRIAGSILAVALAGPACGAASMDAGEEPSPVVYGDPNATTTAPAAPTAAPTTTTAAPRPPSTTPAATARPNTVANRTERLDPSGFFLALVASGATTFKVSDRVTFELTFENRAGHTLVHDSNQDLRFALYRKLGGNKTEPVWSNRDCRASLGSLDDKPMTGILELAPGERGSFVDDYPNKATSEQGFGPDPATCRVAPGEYLLVGFLDWCPNETLRRSEYNDVPYCDRDKVQQLRSAPLALTFV